MKVGIFIGGLAFVYILWLISGKKICKAIDAVFTAGNYTVSPSFELWSYDLHVMNLNIHDGKNELRIDNNLKRVLCKLELDSANNVHCNIGGTRFEMGKSIFKKNGADRYKAHSITPDSLDDFTLTSSRSALFWKEPFKFSLSVSKSPDRYRWVYYRLEWKKPSGRTLIVEWRFVQRFYKKTGWSKDLFPPDNGPTYGMTAVEIIESKVPMR